MEQRSNRPKPQRRLLVILATIVVLMFAFGFALVPIYNVMCKTLGINGKTNATSVEESNSVDNSRTITIEFLATNNEQLHWDFYPKQRKIKFHPGEMEHVAFFAKNKMARTTTVQAIPSVTPGIAAKYLKKTECFCFSQQTLEPGESMDMPILFHIDPDLPKYVHTITLSYTLFDITGRNVPHRESGRLN